VSKKNDPESVVAHLRKRRKKREAVEVEANGPPQAVWVADPGDVEGKRGRWQWPSQKTLAAWRKKHPGPHERANRTGIES